MTTVTGSSSFEMSRSLSVSTVLPVRPCQPTNGMNHG
jgi:hypothetical protein